MTRLQLFSLPLQTLIFISSFFYRSFIFTRNQDFKITKNPINNQHNMVSSLILASNFLFSICFLTTTVFPQSFLEFCFFSNGGF
ncbi:hypothetical protein Hanom_Chr01g00072301 [Helianthus anomalus]